MYLFWSLCWFHCFLPVLQSDLISMHHCLNARRRHDFQRWVCSTLSGQQHRRRTSGAFHVITFPLKLCCNFLRFFAEVVLASLMVWSDIHLHHALPQPLSLQRDERMHQLITIPLCTSHTASHLSTFIILHPDSSTVIVFYSGTPWQTPRDVNKLKTFLFQIQQTYICPFTACWSPLHFCVCSVTLFYSPLINFSIT